MSSRPGASPEMDASLAQRVHKIAAALQYPDTPDLAAIERQRLSAPRGAGLLLRRRRLSLGLAVLFIALTASLLVSPVRARVLEWIRIGSVRIFFSIPTATAPAQTAPAAVMPGTPTPAVSPTHLQSVLDLAGETSLAEAQAQVGFPILLPTIPADLGPPDHVYLQEFGGLVVVLVWMDPDQPDRVRLSLSETASDVLIFEKYEPTSVLDTQVGGQPGVWIDGDYLVVVRNGDVTLTRLVTQGHTLIWSSGEMTFRLETDMDLETALRSAESIR